MLIPIDDIDDPRLDGYRNLRDRDLRDAHGGRFVAEGESVLKVLLSPASLASAESLLVAANRVDTVRRMVGGRDAPPVYVAPPGMMERIVGFDMHRGLLGLGLRPRPLEAAALLADRPRLALGLASIANHDNVGGIFRNAAGFGVGAALIDPATADPYYRKALRVSVGGVLRVPQARVASADAMVDAFLAAGYRVLALSPRGARRLDEVDRTGPLALMLGTEGPGLPESVMARCETVRIDMHAGFDSLNVAVTAGIAIYELSRSESAFRSGGLI